MDCQICLIRCNRVGQFKTHMRSPLHQQKFKEVFQEGMFKLKSGSLPHIVFMDPHGQEMTDSIVGLSLLSLCFCPETTVSFYLCHVCEEVCPLGKIVNHITSGNHYVNYFNYTDPNILFYSWIPNKNTAGFWRRHAKRMMSKNEAGSLRMLHLPEDLIHQLHSSASYSEVMKTLCGNEKLLKQIKASQPKGMMIQTYLRNKNRTHPLIGMQHIVECICDGPDEKRHYLCTLCKLTVTTNKIIKHILSFDHIYCYFKEWHPSTLKSKECYKEGSTTFCSMIDDLSQQANKIHEGENNDMKQVSLEPAEFSSVNFTSYTEALTKLESIKKLNLTTSIKPGNKLVSLYPESLTLQCQNCWGSFPTMSQYIQHLSEKKHGKMLRKFGVVDCFDSYGKAFFHSGMYSLINENCSSQKLPVGTSLVVTCASTRVQTENFCVCFACQDAFQESYLEQHLNSQKHLVHTLLHLNPWRLPFAWKNLPDNSVLRTMALEEERRGGARDGVTLMVFDIPSEIYCNLYSAGYATVLEGLPYHILSRGVPECKMYTKLQQNERFPLLGCHFMVMYVNTDEQVGYLCLLCKRKLLVSESHAHAFSLEHVKTFLVRFHPGSLDTSTDNTEALLDLAKQAMCIHEKTHIQTLWLSRPIWEPCSYSTLTHILGSVKRRERGEKLEPPVVPQGKLVPRGTLKEVHKDNMRDRGQKNSADNEENGQTIEKKGNKETPAQSEKETKRESSERSQKNGGETCERITPKTQEPTVRKPSGESPETNKSTDKDGAETEGKQIKTDVLTWPDNDICVKSSRKRPHSLSENPQEDIHPKKEDAEREIQHKRQRLSLKASCEKHPEMTVSEQTDNTTADMEHQTAAVEKGSLFECRCVKHDPIFLCETCSLKITKSEAIGHVTASEHHPVSRVVVNVDEEVYTNILKQSFKSAVQTVKALIGQPVRGWEHPSGSAPSRVKAVDTPVSFHYPHDAFFGIDNMEVVKMEISDNGSEDSKVAANTSAITKTAAKTTEVARESNKDGARTHMKVSAGTSHATSNIAPHINKNKWPAAPDPTTATSTPAMPEHKKSTKEPSHTSTKPRVKLPFVGVNQLIKVKCGDKQQVYCELCLVRMNGSDHLINEEHQYKYVKMVYPKWSAKPSEMKSRFMKTVIQLGEEEKDQRPAKEMEVTSEVYKELAALPAAKAIEKLKGMLRQKRTREIVTSSPCEVSSSDDANNQSEQQDKKHDQQLAQNPDPHSAHTEQPNQSNTTERLPVTSRLSTSEEHPRISRLVKIQDSSRLSFYLKAKGLDSKIIIGMSYVWECRGICLQTFYLCESCEEKLPLDDICHHMVSHDHQVCYLKKWQTQFLWPFQLRNLPMQLKFTFFYVITRMLSMRESFHKGDAQVILLQEELYKSIHKSPFSEALNMVKRIKQQLDVGCSAISEPQQELTKHMEEFLPTEMWSPETQEPDQESHNATHKTETPHEEEAAMELDGVKERSVNSTTADCGVEPSSNISLHPELTPPNTEHQKPMVVPQIEMNETVVNSLFSTANQDINQNPSLSSNDKNPPTRERSADTSAETLDPLQPVAEASSESVVNPAVSPPLLSPVEKETRADKQKTFSVDLVSFVKLISQLRGRTTQLKAPDIAESVDSAASNLMGMEDDTVEPTATTTDSEPQQGVIEDVSQSISSSAATNHNAGQMLQLQSDTQTDSIRDFQLPINTIVTSRSYLTNHKFMGTCKRQDLTEANRGTQANFSVVPTLPSDTPADPHSQMANVTGQYPAHLSSEAVSGYTAAGSSYPPISSATSEFYTNQVYQQWLNHFGVQAFAALSPAKQQMQPLQLLQPMQQIQIQPMQQMQIQPMQQMQIQPMQQIQTQPMQQMQPMQQIQQVQPIQPIQLLQPIQQVQQIQPMQQMQQSEQVQQMQYIQQVQQIQRMQQMQYYSWMTWQNNQ